MPDLKGSQKRAADHIRRWNGGTQGYLLRNGARRSAIMGIAEYTPKERMLYLDKSTRFYIAAYKLLIEPDHEQDQIEFAGKLYNIVEPVRGPRPGGFAIVYEAITLMLGDA